MKEVVKPDKVFLNSEMPISLAQAVKDLAAQKGISASAVVRWALRDYLSKLDKQGVTGDAIQIPQH